MTPKTVRTIAATILMTAAMSGLPLTAQSRADVRPAPAAPAPPTAGVIQLVEDQNAERTREQLREILIRYPPSLRQVLRLDPSLLTRSDYLTMYPALGAFLAQHPEVAHNPTFFVGSPNVEYQQKSSTAAAVSDIMIPLEITTFFATALFIIGGIARSVLEHKRWGHAMKTQTEAHNKLVDRLATNEDLLAYVQSPAGQRFLTAAPMLPTIEGAARAVGAPIGRILWSVQTGIVLGLAGVGLWVAKSTLAPDVAEPLMVISILAMAVGLGFVVSALASYGISRQLGLIQSSSTHA